MASGLRRGTARMAAWGVVAGVAFATSGCMQMPSLEGSRGGASAGTDGGSALNLISILAGTSSPDVSRKAADAKFVKNNGKNDPTRLDVLEQILYAPGHSDEMRIYAMDQLAEANPARAGNALNLYMPRFDSLPVLSHACDLCVKLGDARLVEALARSLARAASPPKVLAHVLALRPEYGAIEKLSGKPTDEALFAMMSQSNVPSSRVAALDVLQSLLPTAAIVEKVDRTQAKISWMLDLQAFVRTFDVLPIGETENEWIQRVQRPENGALFARAAKRHRQLFDQPDYRFSPRFIGILANVSDALVGLSRAELLTHIRVGQSKLLGAANGTDVPVAMQPATEPTDQSTRVGDLSRGDLLAVAILIDALADRAVTHELERQGLDDLSDMNSAHGGLVELHADQSPVLTWGLTPPMYAASDAKYVPSDGLVQDAFKGLGIYILHFQQVRNDGFAAPTKAERTLVSSRRCQLVILTSVDTRTVRASYVTAAGVGVDLGVFNAE